MRTPMLALFFLLFSFTTKPELVAARPDPVLDTSGEVLRPGISYHILPVFKGKGGGLTFAGKQNTPCPLYVVQEALDIFLGHPLTFSPAIPRDEIHTSSDQNIKFSQANSCGESPVWRLLKEQTGLWFVSTGGVEGNPGFETITTWFKIELAGDDYKLAFCPSVVDAPTLCKELGIVFGHNNERHLALGDHTQPLKVQFKMAEAEPLMSIVAN